MGAGEGAVQARESGPLPLSSDGPLRSQSQAFKEKKRGGGRGVNLGHLVERAFEVAEEAQEELIEKVDRIQEVKGGLLEKVPKVDAPHHQLAVQLRVRDPVM